MNYTFTNNEKKLIGGISLLMIIRMLGISLIVPVFSLFATSIEGSTQRLAGIAVGIYGFSQTLFLLPMGRLSDRRGRKETTLLGLGAYFLGTMLSGMSTNIYFLIVSRFIAGAGAVSGVTMAWLTDGIDTTRRNSALSIVGICIGSAVIAGFALSPLIAGRWGTHWLFYSCGFITLAAIVYTLFFLSNKSENGTSNGNNLKWADILRAIRNKDVIRINLGGLISSCLMTATFFIMPILLTGHMEVVKMWKFYVPMALVGTALQYYFGKRADRIGTRRVAITGFAFEALGMAIPVVSTQLPALVASLICFYAGYCILSPVLLAAISRHPDSDNKGSIMSVFNASQFIGSALGGIISGFLLKEPEHLFILLFAFVCLAFYSIGRFRNYASS